MKKAASLAQQVLKAQKVMETWPESIRSGLRLEGSDIFLKKIDSYSDKEESKQRKR